MAINKKLISFATQEQFDAKVAEIDDRSIVFIEDTKRIWTHGVFFDTPWNYVTGKPNTFTPSAHTHTFTSLTSKPTTLSGYGITDAYTKAQVDSSLNGKVDNTRLITAGNGLTGGGTLAADRTITLGTPSNITLSSTNSVTTDSHTHAFVPGGTTSQYIRGDGSLATYANTTYTTGTLAQLNAGTDTTGRLQTAKLLNDWLNGKGYLSDSLQDGKTYGRKNGGWIEVGSDAYDWTWLFEISPPYGTCTQQQYNDLLAAVQTGNLFPHPTFFYALPMEENGGDVIVLNMIQTYDNDAQFGSWQILPDLTVYSTFFSLSGIIPQSIKLGETYNTAYRGDRGKIAYDHSQTAHDYVPTNSFKGSTFTTNVIPLNNPLGSFRVATASSVATYTLSTTKVIGAWAKILVNRATAPTVTGGTLIRGSDFIAYTNMYLYVSYDGTKSEYYFAEI